MNDNKELVREGYKRFGTGDIEGLLGLFAENIEWTTPEVEGSTLGGTRRGLDGTSEFFQTLDETVNMTEFEPKEFTAEDDRVIVLGHSRATVRETGRSYETDWVHIFTVRDGKIAAFNELFDTAAVERAYQKAESA